MKTILIILFFALIQSTFVEAQKTYFIPKAGTSISTVKFPEGGYMFNYMLFKYKPAVGLMGGAGLDIGLLENNLLAIQPELLFIQKGYCFDFADRDILYRLNYLEIPLLVKLTTGSGKLQTFINGGPSLGAMIGGNVGTGENKIRFKSTATRDDVEMNSRYNLSIHLGGGINYALGNKKLYIEARYGLGLQKMDSELIQLDVYNRFLLVNTGIALPLNKNR